MGVRKTLKVFFGSQFVDVSRILPISLISCYVGSSGSGHTKAGMERLKTAGRGATGPMEG